MTKFLATVLALLAMVMLAGCDGDGVSERQDMDSVSYSYRGEPIGCLKQAVGKTRYFTCDFMSFYAANPDLLTGEDDEAQEDRVFWVDNDGDALACVKMDSSRTSLSCDWARFYQAHPELSPEPR